MQKSEVPCIIAFLLSILDLGSGIRCLQCTSLVTAKCVEGNLPALKCPAESKFCIKYVGILVSDVVVFRECTLNHIGHNCTIKTLEKQRINVCYETCSTDACNGGSAMPPPSARSSESVPYNNTAHHLMVHNTASGVNFSALMTKMTLLIAFWRCVV